MKTKIVSISFALLPTLFALATHPIQAAQILWVNPNGGSWKVASNWSSQRIPGAGDEAYVLGTSNFGEPPYTVTLDGDVTVARLIIGGKQTLIVETNQVLTLAGRSATQSPNASSIQGALYNSGTVRLSFDDTLGIPGSLVNLPNGLVDLTTDVRMIDGNAIDNRGTFRKSGGTGTTSFRLRFLNSGTIDVQNGTLNLSAYLDGAGGGAGVFNTGTGATLQFSGDYSVGSGALLTGNGTYLLSSGTLTLNGNYAFTNFVMSGSFWPALTLLAGRGPGWMVDGWTARPPWRLTEF